MSYFATTEIFSVSQITFQLKSLLENEFRFVHICGEVTNLRQPHSGHLYFTLKDDSAQLKAVLFKSSQKFLDGKIDNGNQLICHGRISVYEPRGEYQLIVDTVDFHGSGNLYLEYERLKKKLQDEGLFDEQRKKPIPPFPREIVLITSPSGAALQDFLKISSLRKAPITIKIFPVRVQGEGSGLEISRAIERVNQEINPDLLVLIRGGGSMEDLWAFNEECVARAISQSDIPVVTGIGHEIDFTIADFCSDLRTPTPTSAAEHVIYDRFRFLEHIRSLARRIELSISSQLEINTQYIHSFRKRIYNLEPLLTRLSLDLDRSFSHLVRVTHSHILNTQNYLDKLTLTLKHQKPTHKLQHLQNTVANLQKRLIHLINLGIGKREEIFARHILLLETVNPLATLKRGYSITRKIDPRTGELIVVSDIDQVEQNEKLQLLLHKGELECEVTNVKK